jgi:cell division protein ZapE
MSAAFGRGRLDGFVSHDFRRNYHVVFVGGDDYRLRQHRMGRAFIGQGADERLAAEAALADGHSALFSFADLMARATHTERRALAHDLARLDTLFIQGVNIAGTDDALRLLRLIDDLYSAPEAPTLFLSAQDPPADWFPLESQPAGLARAVAEKFRRTTSRIEGLVEIVLADALN